MVIAVAALYILAERMLAQPYQSASEPFLVTGFVVILTLPSVILNWLYDVQDAAQTQREWMKVPNGLLARASYVVTGSIALWALLGVGIVLAALVMGGLISLGQAAWST